MEVVTDGCPLQRRSRAGRRRYLPVAGAAQVRASQIGRGQVGGHQARAEQARANHDGAAQVGVAQVRAGHAGQLTTGGARGRQGPPHAIPLPVTRKRSTKGQPGGLRQ